MGSTFHRDRSGHLARVLLRTQPDERLVELARSGSAPAFGEIARRHQSALTAFARSLAPPSQAEDVVQDSLVKAQTALLEHSEPVAIRSWLFRIVRNTAIDAQRGARHHEELDENYDGVEQPPQVFERQARVAALVSAVKDLPRPQREAIVQRELEGRGHGEIAASLSVSPGAVRQLIYRARYSLREAAGLLVPGALLRLALMPGAGEVAGGTGMAVATKVGLAAVLATGTIVAGTAIERHGGPRASAADVAVSGAGAGGSAIAGPSGNGAKAEAEARHHHRGNRPSGSGKSGGSGRGESHVADSSGHGSGGSGSGSGSGGDGGSGSISPNSGSGSTGGSSSGSGDGAGTGSGGQGNSFLEGDASSDGGGGTSGPG